MVKNISALGAIKGFLLLLIVTGVGLFSEAFLRSPVFILITPLLVFMIAEDWVEQTIDVPALVIMTFLLLIGSFDRSGFCIKYIFLWLFFRSCFLWLMRFDAPDGDSSENIEEKRCIHTGFLPFFCASLCIAYIQTVSSMDIFQDIYIGYMIASSDLSNSPEILAALLAILIFVVLAGEKRRRSVPANTTETWPFGDGDVWFLSAWGAAMPLSDFFLVFLISQLMLLFTYGIKYLDGDLQHE